MRSCRVPSGGTTNSGSRTRRRAAADGGEAGLAASLGRASAWKPRRSRLYRMCCGAALLASCTVAQSPGAGLAPCGGLQGPVRRLAWRGTAVGMAQDGSSQDAGKWLAWRRMVVGAARDGGWQGAGWLSEGREASLGRGRHGGWQGAARRLAGAGTAVVRALERWVACSMLAECRVLAERIAAAVRVIGATVGRASEQRLAVRRSNGWQTGLWLRMEGCKRRLAEVR
eukprot:358525-Chlamydomonas_euryale.AAC.1